MVLLKRMIALGGLCTLFAVAGSIAGAQDIDHHDMGVPGHHTARRVVHHKIHRLQSRYAHDIAVGDRAAARRAHHRAQMIRARARARRALHHDHDRM
jgi:hypothetical protein